MPAREFPLEIIIWARIADNIARDKRNGLGILKDGNEIFTASGI
jgi:uncharacterized protein YigE (DUF2233 family)